MATEFIITADLHQSIGNWRDLVRAVEQEKPRFVLIAGDLLPKHGGFNGQRGLLPGAGRLPADDAWLRGDRDPDLVRQRRLPRARTAG